MQGDSVNTASRMESNGFPMTIHVSEAFYQDAQDTSMFVACGPRVIKGKGSLVTYLVKVNVSNTICANYLQQMAWQAAL